MPTIKNMTNGPLILNEVSDKPISIASGGAIKVQADAMYNPEIQRLLQSGIIKQVADGSPVAPAAKKTTKKADEKTVVTVSADKKVQKTTTKKTTTKKSTKKATK